MRRSEERVIIIPHFENVIEKYAYCEMAFERNPRKLKIQGKKADKILSDDKALGNR